MLVVHRLIVMKMAKQPVMVPDPVFDLLQKVCQPVHLSVGEDLPRYAGGGAVGQNVVHRPVMGIQVFSGLLILLIGGEFLRLPGYPFNPEPGTASAHPPVPFLEARFLRIQDAVLNVVGGRPPMVKNV